jgi:hypothetical protein
LNPLICWIPSRLPIFQLLPTILSIERYIGQKGTVYDGSRLRTVMVIRVGMWDAVIHDTARRTRAQSGEFATSMAGLYRTTHTRAPRTDDPKTRHYQPGRVRVGSVPSRPDLPWVEYVYTRRYKGLVQVPNRYRTRCLPLFSRRASVVDGKPIPQRTDEIQGRLQSLHDWVPEHPSVPQSIEWASISWHLAHTCWWDNSPNAV